MTVTTARSAPAADTRSRETRIRLKPGTGGHGHVDGAWWPYSHDAATELPGLIAELQANMGTVSRVSYRLDDWDATNRKLFTEGRLVRLEGFRTMPAGTVTLIGGRTQRLTLLVVPPDCTDGVATAILTTASNPDDSSSPRELLAALSPDEGRDRTTDQAAGGTPSSASSR